tara:strand:- start:292 stop:486 length:195 start_codon:yes stop_codon:yes gene_type:complete
MEDLIQIIKWRDEISEINYTITRLELAEQAAVDDENYEKAQLMLMEKARLIRRRKYLETKIKNK